MMVGMDVFATHHRTFLPASSGTTPKLNSDHQVQGCAAKANNAAWLPLLTVGIKATFKFTIFSNVANCCRPLAR
jgi:hypothetical protein